jgi:alpha-1,2-mannosyltransferase
MSQGTDRSHYWSRGSALLWGAVFLTITLVHWKTFPNGRTVAGLYRDAAEAWWAHQGLYKGPGGMNYLPHFAILFTPFQMMPLFVGELLWRWASIGCVMVAWWRLASLVSLSDRSRKWMMVFGSSAIAMAACGDAFRSGQANAMFSGLVLLGIGFLIERRWWPAAVAVLLGMAVKPLGLVLVGLVFIGYREMMKPLALGFVVFALFPFCFAPPAYVVEQLQAAVTNLLYCSLVTEHRFADLNGMLRFLGWDLTGTTNQIARVGVGGITALIWFVASRQSGHLLRELILLTLAVSYLMLFNPMTEVNSYVIMAPGFAILGMYLIGRQDGRFLGGAILLGVLSIGVLPELMRRIAPHFGLWWDPFVTILCLVGFLRYAYGRWKQESSSHMAELARNPHLTHERLGT